MFLIHLLA
ncbi:rCG22567 [Rattus norvegicus]|uniref:RCG22567 n=1 Tax=Rattus norvegicus TaxID=10116 RepID=A6INZ0_RAT|nr:rCG22567 [Rattus norvegicus]